MIKRVIRSVVKRTIFSTGICVTPRSFRSAGPTSVYFPTRLKSSYIRTVYPYTKHVNIRTILSQGK